MLEFLLRGPDEVLLLDEPDNFLDVPGKIWLEQRIRESRQDDPLRQPRPRAAGQHRDPGRHRRARRARATPCGRTRAGSRRYHEARRDRFARFEELRRRWDEEHAKLKALVLQLQDKAEYNDGMASQYQAAQTRLRKFEEAGPPQASSRASSR